MFPSSQYHPRQLATTEQDPGMLNLRLTLSFAPPLPPPKPHRYYYGVRATFGKISKSSTRKGREGNVLFWQIITRVREPRGLRQGNHKSRWDKESTMSSPPEHGKEHPLPLDRRHSQIITEAHVPRSRRCSSGECGRLNCFACFSRRQIIMRIHIMWQGETLLRLSSLPRHLLMLYLLILGPCYRHPTYTKDFLYTVTISLIARN